MMVQDDERAGDLGRRKGIAEQGSGRAVVYKGGGKTKAAGDVAFDPLDTGQKTQAAGHWKRAVQKNVFAQEAQAVGGDEHGAQGVAVKVGVGGEQEVLAQSDLAGGQSESVGKLHGGGVCHGQAGPNRTVLGWVHLVYDGRSCWGA